MTGDAAVTGDQQPAGQMYPVHREDLHQEGGRSLFLYINILLLTFHTTPRRLYSKVTQPASCSTEAKWLLAFHPNPNPKQNYSATSNLYYRVNKLLIYVFQKLTKLKGGIETCFDITMKFGAFTH